APETATLTDILGEGSAPEPAAAVEAPEAIDAPPAPAPEATDPAGKPEKEAPFWYRKEIEKERRQRQQEAQSREQLERELEKLRGQPQRPETPDPLENPQGFQSFIEQCLEQQRLVDRLERSEERFTDKHGEQTFEEVRDWLATRPDIEQWALGQRDPWRAAHQQFTKERLASEIGDDPNAWREKERQRLRDEILAEMGGQPPAPQMRLPPPASGARSAAPRDGQGRFTGPVPLNDLLSKKGMG